MINNKENWVKMKEKSHLKNENKTRSTNISIDRSSNKIEKKQDISKTDLYKKGKVNLKSYTSAIYAAEVGEGRERGLVRGTNLEHLPEFARTADT